MFMTAKLTLVKNDYMTDGEETYRAVIKHNETLSQEDLLDEMEWHSTTLTRTDMRAFLESHEQTIVRALTKGKRVVTNLVHYQLTAKGNFIDEDDQLDDERHSIGVSVSRGTLLRRAVNNKTVTLERERAVQPVPRLDSCTNLCNGDPDTVLTPTYNAQLEGDKLRFNSADPEQGLFLIPQANGSGPVADPTPVRVEDIARLTNRNIIFRVPNDLPAGHYKVEVRRRFGQTRLATGTLQTLLMVN